MTNRELHRRLRSAAKENRRLRDDLAERDDELREVYDTLETAWQSLLRLQALRLKEAAGNDN